MVEPRRCAIWRALCTPSSLAVISGGTGTGKTTLLNVVSSFIPDHDRIVTIEDAKELERHYIGPRYPNSYPEGAPGDFYTAAEAQRAITAAERIVEHCQRHLVR